jgi:hypothetical protein
VWVLAALAVMSFALPPRYVFPAPRSFRGEQLHNPYASQGLSWHRVNLHAHSRAWFGLTNGVDTPRDIVNTYLSRGYALAALSNYMQHTPEAQLSLYEHGYNLALSHQLVVGAQQVSWYDSLWPTIDAKQFVLRRLEGDDTLVVLAHPWLKQSYAVDELERLQNYQAVEVANHAQTATEPWDAALTSGHRVWGIANDDTHNLAEPGHTFVAFTWVRAPSAGANDIQAALRAGQTVAARNDQPNALPANQLDNVSVDGLSFTAQFTAPFAWARCVADHGRETKRVEHSQRITCALGIDESYTRVEAATGTELLLLNPLTRIDAPKDSVDINWGQTFSQWILTVLMLVGLLQLTPRYFFLKTTK